MENSNSRWTNTEQFYNLKNYPGFPRTSTKEFWKLLGFTNTVCLDINGQHDSIYCDLNFPFDDINHIGKYDLVTDFGNNEHPFNVVEAYKTMHKLCKKMVIYGLNKLYSMAMVILILTYLFLKDYL